MTLHSTTTCLDCQIKDLLIAQLRWDDDLGMLNRAGLFHAIRTLPVQTSHRHVSTYTVVLADIDRLKAINGATGNHVQTNRYLAAGLAVRAGEIVGQLYGDEFLFILDEHGPIGGRRENDSPEAFVARISRQLAGQPLTISEKYMLAAAQGCHVSVAKLSATFAVAIGVTAGEILTTIEALSQDVLGQKRERDTR